MLLSKKITVVSSMAMALVVTGLALTAKPVSASSYNETELSQNSMEPSTKAEYHLFTEAEAKEISNLITVKNGKYLVDSDKAGQASLNQVKLAKQFVDQVNETRNNIRLYGVNLAHAHHKYFTYRNFTWGTRYYFSTNAAVAQMQSDLTNKCLIIGGAGAAASVIGGAIPGLIGTFGAGYFEKMSSDLGAYNAAHSNKQIYMDLNWAGIYSFHIWH